jgi:hypothetical protein
MAKAITLNPDDFATPPALPQAAKAPTAAQPVAVARAKAPPVPKVPFQILVSKEDAKAIRRAAVEADQSYSDFLVSCFHKSMKS